MYWIALQPSPDEDTTAWVWRALQFTPRVAAVEESILLEVGASERLFGGRRKLLARLLFQDGSRCAWAGAATSLQALALLRLKSRGLARPLQLPQELPLATLSAAVPHLATLERIGCTTWGQLRRLPRAGVSRRFGKELLQALDAAHGERAESYAWETLPEAFDLKQELAALATSTGELMVAAQRLLALLQLWLQARNLGVLELGLEWTHDLRKIDGRPLPATEQVVIGTAQPTQDMRHLRRLASERLARLTLAAPANQLRLRSLQTVPWAGAPTSLLPDEATPGERLHQLVERLSARLGDGSITVPNACQDHRPECMQQWQPARQAAPRCEVRSEVADALYPPWLLPQPLRLPVRKDQPCYPGPLKLLTRARRVEAAWWDPSTSQPVVRDYFVARSEEHGLLWVFRERLAADQDHAQWFLHGIYA